MRFLKLLFLILLPIPALAQTLDLESMNLQRKFMSGEWDQEKYLRKASDFRALLKDMGGYPELDYNLETSQIEYKYILEVSPDKDVIFRRINEWAAMKFGSLDAVMHYSDLLSGKIILKGNFDVNFRADFKFFWTKYESIKRKTCYQTYVFTIVDQRVKVEINKVRYEISLGYENMTSEISINEVYPITNSPSISWKSNLDMLYQTKNHLSRFAGSVQSYINNFEEDYEF
tara:strand:- start:25 stop:714 length:690 start_codon:yes stop_codon:yes gene_type:complete